MWSHDKKLLAAYRECMQGIVEQLNQGEEVDYDGMCDGEMNKLMGYTHAMLEEYEFKYPIKVSEKRQLFYTPKMPHFQNL